MILSIDPGETTGLALLDEGILALTMCTGKEQLWKLLGKFGPLDAVCIEDFVTAGRISKHGLYTTRLVGSVEALSWLHGFPCQRQVPNFRTGFLNRSLSLIRDTVGADHEHRHEKDALAHLMAYLDNEGRKVHGPRDLKHTRVVRTTIDALQSQLG